MTWLARYVNHQIVSAKLFLYLKYPETTFWQSDQQVHMVKPWLRNITFVILH